MTKSTTYTVRPFGIRRNENIACSVTVRGDKTILLKLSTGSLVANECQRLADCAIGFGQGAMGGKRGQIYVVSDSTDGDHVKPPPETLLLSKANLMVSPTDIVGRVKLDGDGPTIRGYIISGLAIVLLPGSQTD
ncbi:putative pectate lyase 12 [Tanacetum coccineum]